MKAKKFYLAGILFLMPSLLWAHGEGTCDVQATVTPGETGAVDVTWHTTFLADVILYEQNQKILSREKHGIHLFKDLETRPVEVRFFVEGWHEGVKHVCVSPIVKPVYPQKKTSNRDAPASPAVSGILNCRSAIMSRGLVCEDPVRILPVIPTVPADPVVPECSLTLSDDGKKMEWTSNATTSNRLQVKFTDGVTSSDQPSGSVPTEEGRTYILFVSNPEGVRCSRTYSVYARERTIEKTMVERQIIRVVDTDGDGLCNHEEDAGKIDPVTEKPCSLHQGRPDNCPTVVNPAQNVGDCPLSIVQGASVADTDADQMPDDLESLFGTRLGDPDTDKDGILDGVELKLGFNPLDVDTDGDGVCDGVPIDVKVLEECHLEAGQADVCPLVFQSVQNVSACVNDADGDGVQDAQDNCRFVANSNQIDADKNGVGDACKGSPFLWSVSGTESSSVNNSAGCSLQKTTHFHPKVSPAPGSKNIF